MTQPMYILMPMKQKPDKDGFYILVSADPKTLHVVSMWFENGEWLALPRMMLAGWLKEISPEELLEEKRKIAGEGWDACNVYSIWDGMPNGILKDELMLAMAIVDKETYLKNIK